MHISGSEYKEAFVSYQQENTLNSGKMILLIGLPAALYFVLQDIFVLKLSGLIYFRLIIVIPLILYGLAWFTVLKTRRNLIVYFHSFLLVALNASMLSIMYYFFAGSVTKPTDEISVIHSYTVCIFIIFIASGIARKFFIPITVVPLGIFLAAVLINIPNIDRALLSQLSNPVLLIVFLSAYAFFSDKRLYHEFVTSEELKRVNSENKQLNDKLSNELEITRHTEQLLRESERKYRLLTEFSSDAIWVFNCSFNRFTYVSPGVYQLTGFTVEEFQNKTIAEAMSPDFVNSALEEISTCKHDFLADLDGEKTYVREFKLSCKNGGDVWIEVAAKFRVNENSGIEIVGTSRNIEKRKKSEAEVLYLSYHDQLTGLYNRRFYENEIIRLNDDKSQLPLALIMVDVNGLKLTNDAFGHTAGDLLLQRAARILKTVCRTEDVVARIGGDEFIILLPKTEKETAAKITEQINQAILNEKTDNIILSVSVGFAVRKSISEDMNEIFMQAEDNMYRHKLSESSSMRSRTIDIIMNTLYEKNDREMEHTKRVSEVCKKIAENMNFNRNEINEIGLAGLMHDIGKIGIQDKILNKPAQLDSSEWNEVERHSEIGYRILSSANEFAKIAGYVLEHHEKYDGTGYPKGLKGEEISVQARIVAIADAYDAMTNERTYKNMMSEEEAAEEIKKCAGTQFDPAITRIFVETVLNRKQDNR